MVIYRGATTGLAVSPAFVLSGAGATGFGVSMGGAGDLNGDGRLDALVGASQTSGDNGAAYVFYGDAVGVSTGAGTTLTGTVIGGGFGRWVAHQ